MTKRGYLHPQKTYVWITLLVIGVMSLLYFILGINPNAQGSIPPAFNAGVPGNFGVSDLYFHSIAVGFAALGVYLVFMVFDLDKFEPPIDFPLSYRALVANILTAIGAFFYLRPVFNSYLAPIPLGLIFVGLILLADVGGALLIELYLYPGKLAGSYNPDSNMFGMIPRWSSLPSFKDFRKMDSTYWLTFVSVIGTFIAGITGFVAMWMNYFVILIGRSPGLLTGYVNWLGGSSTVLGNAIGSHSHAIVMCLLLGIVAVTAKRFEVLSYTGWKRTVTIIGLWVAITGVIALTIMFFLETYTTVFPAGKPPLLFATNPDTTVQFYSYSDLNGMASDDTTMLWAAIGAMIVLVPLFFTKARGTPIWRDPVRSSILLTWIFTFIATPVEGFYIEFHESSLAGAPQDLTFGALQYFALIGIPVICMALLAVDFYVDQRRVRTPIAGLAILSILLALVGGYYYTFLNWQQGTWAYWLFDVGFVLMAVFILAAMVAVILGVPEKFADGESVPPVPSNGRKKPKPAAEPDKTSS
ncbi:MAG TPA: hypothetical protein VEH28_05720 [Thermoplasmata archaeon]|nr:hypothetical protein [Thermoplasmata archaeon]